MNQPAEALAFQNPDGVPHIRCDAPGERAVSAPVDPIAFFVQACDAWDIEYDDSVEGQVTISIPPDA